MARHVTIIGGGIIGLACAYYLQQDGHQVRLIEQTTIGNSCALGNAGYVSPSHFIPLAAPGMIKKGLKWMFNPESPFYLQPRFNRELIRWLWLFNRSCTQKHVNKVKSTLFDLCMRSRALYVQLAEDLPDSFGWQTNGIYVLCQSEKAMDEELEILRQGQALGAQVSAISPSELAQKYPDIEFDIQGGVYFGDDAHLHPGQLLERLHASLKNSAVEIIENCVIDSINLQHEKVQSVGGNGDVYPVDELVVASGAWSPNLLRQLNLKLPIQAGKGYSVTMDNPWQLDTPMILSEGAVAVTPFGQQIRFGGTLELSGLDLSIKQRRVEGIFNSVKRFIPNFDLAAVNKESAWAGLRPCSPDGLPLIGRVAQFQNLLIASGHAMLGLTLAPISGRIIADIIGGRLEQDWPHLSPDRFQ